MRSTLAIIVLALMFVSTSMMFGCTDQQRARKIGGTAKVELASGRKLVVATWKDSNLWILTRPMRSGELAETYEFSESSSFGVFEGNIFIIERK
jgi:hypothetical protein